MTEEDPYADANGVLINKLGITSSPALSRAEADLSFAAMLRLSTHPLPGEYDLKHLQSFHRQLFSAIYPWAGNLRTVDLARTTRDMFCHWPYIESYSASVFHDLTTEHRLADLAASFPWAAARDAGWRIAWRNLNREENDFASAAALQGDTLPLMKMFEGLVQPR